MGHGTRWSWTSATFYVVIALTLGGCAAELGPCKVRCGTGAAVCPATMTCGTDDYCHDEGETAQCNLVPGDDAGLGDGAMIDLRGTDIVLPDGSQPAVVLGFSMETSGVTSSLLAVWASSATDVYIAGDKGVILHGDGTGSFTPQTNPVASTDRINGLWGSSKSDIYAVTSTGVIVHSIGDGTWQKQATSTTTVLKSVWGASATDVYVAGYDGTMLHSTGDGVWHPQTYGGLDNLRFVAGMSASQVFAGGFGTKVRRSTGNGVWTEQSASSFSAEGGWGDPSGIWIVGSQSLILRSPGNDVWTTEAASGTGSGILNGVWGQGASSVYAVGGFIYHTTGDGNWQALTGALPSTLRAIGGAGSEAYAVGDAGIVFHGK